jgi:hypothetical protein
MRSRREKNASDQSAAALAAPPVKSTEKRDESKFYARMVPQSAALFEREPPREQGNRVKENNPRPSS